MVKRHGNRVGTPESSVHPEPSVVSIASKCRVYEDITNNASKFSRDDAAEAAETARCRNEIVICNPFEGDDVHRRTGTAPPPPPGAAS